MPTEFDEMSEKASLGYKGHSKRAKKNGQYLRDVMESVVSFAYEIARWHFYDVTTEPTPFLDFKI